MADIDLSDTACGMVTVATASDVTVTLAARCCYELRNMGRDAAGDPQLSSDVYFSTDGSAVVATLAQAAHKGYLRPTTSVGAIYSPPTRIGPSVTTLKMKATGTELVVMVTRIPI